MANLQIKGIDDALYMQVKELAISENRSISQQVLFLLKTYIANKKQFENTKSPAQKMLSLAGSWDDARTAEELVDQIKTARKNSTKLTEGL